MALAPEQSVVCDPSIVELAAADMASAAPGGPTPSPVNSVEDDSPLSTGPNPTTARPGRSGPDEKSTYFEIIRSSALIGGASVLNILVGIVRTKATAILLGPAGVGLMGLFGAISDLAVALAGMGAGSAGVRQIAEAVGSRDERRIARTVAVLRRTTLVLGALGALLLFALSAQVSALTFGSEIYAGAVALLGVAVFCRLITEGQNGLIQGMRRIADLAKMGVLGTAGGAIATVALVYAFGEAGIAIALAGGAAIGLAVSWVFARRIRTEPVALTYAETRDEAIALLRLGFAFMLSGVLMIGASYLVRMMVVRKLGLDAAGLYQAAWTLGAMYVTIILSAMNKDYYPRLTSVAQDRAVSNRMVNEQAHVSMLLAGPGILATLTLSRLVLAAFFSSDFEAAAGILRWICLATTLQVIMVPVGYIILAKNAQRYFVGTELVWTAAHVGLAWIFLGLFGLNGSGMAFFGAYVLHGLLIYFIVRRINGFRWSKENRRTGMLLVASVALVFFTSHAMPSSISTAIGGIATVLSAAYSLRVLSKLAPLGQALGLRPRRSR